MKTIEERNELVLNYMPLAKSIAFKKKQNSSFTLEELQSAAYFGLIDAAIKYDANKSPVFSSYAKIRINGEILDFIKNNSKQNLKCVDFDSNEPLYFENDNFLEEFFELLDESDRVMMKDYYVHGLSMKEIGEMNNISESRVCQKINSCKKILKENLMSA